MVINVKKTGKNCTTNPFKDKLQRLMMRRFNDRIRRSNWKPLCRSSIFTSYTYRAKGQKRSLYDSLEWLKHLILVVGLMSKLILYWQKGNKRIYTKRLDVAEQAMEEGHMVTILKNAPYIFKKYDFYYFN